jgi:iron complex outermembrane receptor protein
VRRCTRFHAIKPKEAAVHAQARTLIGVPFLIAIALAPAELAAQEAQAPPATPPSAAAQRAGVEEIVVTARQKEETLQDVPVTVAAFTTGDLERYNVQNLVEASKLVPNFQIVHGNSGNGSNLYLRGVGSSSISAAFDQSVAINIDGVIANIGRMIHNAYLDLGQLEVLKGPQSLYFGKSATAGVVSVRTKDPGEELEIELMTGYEFNYEKLYTEGVISTPITETLGVRLAAGWTRADKLRENVSTAAKHHWRGDEAINTRLTLVWDPLESLRARFKLNYSKYENDGANGNTEARCVEGTQQPTNSTLGGVFTNYGEDCKFNGNFSISDVTPKAAVGLPYGGSDGVPFLDQDTWLTSLDLSWDITETLSLTSITGYVNLDHKELDVYCYCSPTLGSTPAGFYNGLHRNVYKSVSQEIRLGSDFDFPLNFQAGFFFQDIEQAFEAYQYAVNTVLFPGAPGLPVFFLPDGRDVVTGNGYDYNKNHYLDTTVYSVYLAGYWDIVEGVELTAGVRYTNEDKDGRITIPYMHSFLSGALGFLPSGSVISTSDGLKFDDDDWSPEVALSWMINDQVTLYGAYKQGFKSGGIDNSALPNNTLNTSNPAFPGILIYDSETAHGGEVGVKSSLFDDSLRLNVSVFYYVYEDLQVQQFNSALIQFATFNASELTTKGAELDFHWTTPIDNLSFRGAIALTDADYTKEFIQVDGQDLNGNPRERSADVAWYLGSSYEIDAGGGWWVGLSTDVRYSSGYPLEGRVGAFEQDAFTLLDAAVRLYTGESRWEIAVIGKNLTDKTYAFSEGSRPGAVPSVPGGLQDRVTTTSLGREILLQLRFRY